MVGERQDFLFGSGDEMVSGQHDRAVLPQIAQLHRLVRRPGYFGETDDLEGFLYGNHRPKAARRETFALMDEHAQISARSRDQSDADLHGAAVKLGQSYDLAARGDHLESTAEAHAERRRDHGKGRVLDRLRNPLEGPGDLFEKCELLALGQLQDERQVGAGAKVRAVVGNDQSLQASRSGIPKRLLQHVENGAVDGIELRLQGGVELDASHTVTDVHERRAPVAQDFAAPRFDVASTIRWSRTPERAAA